MKRMAGLFFVMLFLFLPSVSMAKGSQVVVFDDPVLEAALRKEVGIPEGDVTDKDLAKVTRLGIERNYEEKPDPSTQVHSIAALAYCTKLTTLQLNFQNIADISPLENLKKIKTLELGGSPITDIAPLAKLTSLDSLALFNCQASDYSPLAKLKKLTALYLDFSTISDLTPLSGLTKLKSLGLKRTPVTDVSPLAKLTSLRTLYLSECDIGDYTPIKKIYGKLKDKDFDYVEVIPTPVTEAVAFDDPVLESVIRRALGKPEGTVYAGELAALTELGTGFDYEQNPPEGSRVKSIEALKYCVNLTILELNFNQITDVSALAGLAGLTDLSVGGNQIEDIAPLSGLTNLKWLALFNCRAKDYAPLANLTNLQSLLLEYSSISDLSPLAGLTNLRRLNLKNCMIMDYTTISAILPNLTEKDFDPDHPVTAITFSDPMLEALLRSKINVQAGAVTDWHLAQVSELSFVRFNDRPASEDIYDLSDLRYCTGLTQLTLNNIAATDLSPLAGLTKLEGLTLNSKASDYSALAGLTGLKWLDLSGSAITDLTPLAGLTNLEGLSLCYTGVSDLTPLRNMTKLFGLKLEGAPVKDYTPLTEIYPNLGKRDFVIPEPGLVGFADSLLEQRVRSAMNKPDGDITTGEAAAVRSLDLSQDQSSGESIVLLQGLEAFTGLTELNLSGNTQLVNLWPISGLTGLEKLNCWKCNVFNLEPIRHLTGLKEFILGWNGSVGNLDALSGLVNLQALDAKGVGLSDIRGLAGLPKLQYVGLNNNNITDMSPLATLPSLTEAELKGNPTNDFSALADIYPQMINKDFTIVGGWRYDEPTRTLFIESDEAMVPFAPDQENVDAATRTDAPWSLYLTQIEQITVGDGVTKISDYAFAYATALRKVTIGKDVASLGMRCLYRCDNAQSGEELEIIVNCSSMPSLGEDVMGYTWDSPQTVVRVPESQIDQWLKDLSGGGRRIVVQ